MHEFQSVSPYELTENFFELFDNRWALLTAEQAGKANTMTVGWGGVGILWNKPVALAVVRPQRYTMEFLAQRQPFSLSFFRENERREELAYCGRVSGRQEDKIARCGFTVEHEGGIPYLAEAGLVLLCRQLYVQDMKEECFLDPALVERFYPQRDLHTMFLAEIEAVLKK